MGHSAHYDADGLAALAYLFGTWQGLTATCSHGFRAWPGMEANMHVPIPY